MTLNRDERIDAINQALLEIAEGNFRYLAPVSDELDDIDAIASGVNMLSEELRDTVISRNYLNSILGGIVDMLIIFDKHLRIKRVNSKVCELLAQPDSYFIDQPMDILFDGRKTKFIANLKDSLQKKENIYNLEASFKTSDSGRLPVTISLSRLQDNRESIGYVLIAKDLQHIQLTSDALRQKNDELKTLVYRVSHDLKGPLASMQGLLQVIEQTETDLPTLHYYISLIKQSADKLHSTLMGLLEIGVSDRTKLTMQSFDVYDCICDVIESLANYPNRDNINITIEYDSPVLFTSSEKLFRSVFQNLVENSIKYHQYLNNTPFIKISIKPWRGGIEVTVKDNGEGMNKAILDRAFDMFYRGNQTSSGSGLGLFIVKSNVEKLGGDLKIKSKPDHGTEVKIYLPSLDKF